MKKDSFEKTFEASSIIELDFKEISSKIGYDKYTSRVQSSKKRWLKTLIPSFAVALSLLVIIPIVVNSVMTNTQEDNTNVDLSSMKDKYGWGTEYVLEVKEPMDNTSLIPTWDDKSIIQKFPNLTVNNKGYSVVSTLAKSIDEKYIGDYVDEVTFTGYDIYHPEENKTGKGKVFKIKNIITDCAYAVMFDGRTDYYAYINPYYSFKTLGELKNKLNLSEYLSFGKGHYSYYGKDDTHLISFEDCDDSLIWDNLLSDDSLANASLVGGSVANPNDTFSATKLSFSVAIPCFGYENISLGINDKGYIQTNIFEVGKTFYIGVDKAKTFMEKYFSSVKGHEIIYYSNDSTGTATKPVEMSKPYSS